MQVECVSNAMTLNTSAATMCFSLLTANVVNASISSAQTLNTVTSAMTSASTANVNASIFSA